LQTVAVLNLVFPLGVKNVDPIEETFKLSHPGLVLGLVMSRPLYVGHRVVLLSLVIVLGGARLI
jgi:hypothetical protein